MLPGQMSILEKPDSMNYTYIAELKQQQCPLSPQSPSTTEGHKGKSPTVETQLSLKIMEPKKALKQGRGTEFYAEQGRVGLA